MKRLMFSLFIGTMIAVGSVAGTYVLDIQKGWNFLGAKADMIADEIGLDKNITEILAFENGKWITWKAGQKDNELKVIFAKTGFWVNSKENVKIEITVLNDKLVSYSNAKVKFQVPLERVKKLYIDDQMVEEKDHDIKIDKKEIENFTILLSSTSELEGVHNFTVETVDGVKISKDIEISFKSDKMIRGWSFSTSYGYCGSRTNGLSRYASDWVVDLYHSGKGDVYIGNACRRHDSCYQNQWGKSYCDSRFYSDMKNQCRRVYGYNPRTWREKASLGACLYKAWTYYKAVVYGGYSAYQEAGR